jgi:hypothetical protein
MSGRFTLILLLFPCIVISQMSHDSAAFFIRDIYRQSYVEQQGYQWLTTLTKDIGPRLSGWEGSEKAIRWAKDVLDTCGVDSVWLQEVKVQKWDRGDDEHVIMFSDEVGAVTLMALALGHSPGTGVEGLRAEVIEVHSLDQLNEMRDEDVEGKIVFFNRPMDIGLPSTFSAYGGAADQRYYGPSAAAKKGAVAAVVRSLSSRLDDYPHTGLTLVADTLRNIPSVAVSTNDADRLSLAIKKGKTEVFIRTTCRMIGEVTSYNVIGELRGRNAADGIILIGGHLDSWDVGEGAHDDGAGCMHAIEVMYRLAKNGYRPNHTIRCVLFANEESGLAGGRKYAEEAISKNEYHLVAIESDGGAGTPQGFGCSAGAEGQLDKYLIHMSEYTNLLETYDLQLRAGGGGADIGPLRPVAGLLCGLRPDNSRYFDYHHSHLDVLENVHPRELASGSAALTSFVFLVDQYGIGR